jgi:hypothetical protein
MSQWYDIEICTRTSRVICHCADEADNGSETCMEKRFVKISENMKKRKISINSLVRRLFCLSVLIVLMYGG